MAEATLLASTNAKAAATADTAFTLRVIQTTSKKQAIAANVVSLLQCASTAAIKAFLDLEVGTDFPAVLSAAPAPNHIINGDMEMWQRGTTFSGPVTGTVSADRWKYLFGGGVLVVDLLRSTDVPTVAEAGRKLNYSLHIDVTTADASATTTDNANLQYRMEGYDWRRLAQRDLVLSFWIKSTKTGTYTVCLNNIVDRTYIAEYTVSVTNTWEFKTVTFPASPSAGTWDYTTGIGVAVIWTFMAGDDASIRGTAGSWLSTTQFSTANQVNAVDNAANNIRLTGIKLEPGSVVTRHEPETFPELLRKCQRYCRVDTLWVPTAGADKGGVTIDMRGVPTITGGGAGFASTGTTATGIICEQTTGAAATLTSVSEL